MPWVKKITLQYTYISTFIFYGRVWVGFESSKKRQRWPSQVHCSGFLPWNHQLLPKEHTRQGETHSYKPPRDLETCGHLSRIQIAKHFPWQELHVYLLLVLPTSRESIWKRESSLQITIKGSVFFPCKTTLLFPNRKRDFPHLRKSFTQLLTSLRYSNSTFSSYFIHKHIIPSFPLLPGPFKPFQYNLNPQQSSVTTCCKVVIGLIDEIVYSPLSQPA